MLAIKPYTILTSRLRQNTALLAAVQAQVPTATALTVVQPAEHALMVGYVARDATGNGTLGTVKLSLNQLPRQLQDDIHIYIRADQQHEQTTTLPTTTAPVPTRTILKAIWHWLKQSDT